MSDLIAIEPVDLVEVEPDPDVELPPCAEEPEEGDAQPQVHGLLAATPSILGFSVITAYGNPLIGTYLVPGSDIKLSLRKEVAPLLLAVARDFDREVEDLIKGQCGGFNPRKIAGSKSWSRHALGCAMDLNWNLHPMGASDTFTDAKEAALKKIVARYKVIRWGGGFSRPDDMHLEVNAARDKVLAAVKALQTPTKPKPAGGNKPGSRIIKLTSPMMKGEDVAWAQRWTGADDDGVFGKASQARVARYQRIVGISQSGRIDGPTWSKMLGRKITL